MHQKQNEQRQRDLNELETLVIQGCEEGSDAGNLMKRLCLIFPYHFIQLMKKHGRLEVPADDSLLVKCYIVAVHLTEKHYRKLQHYLVQPPKNEEEEKEFFYAIHVLEPIILRQTSGN